TYTSLFRSSGLSDGDGGELVLTLAPSAPGPVATRRPKVTSRSRRRVSAASQPGAQERTVQRDHRLPEVAGEVLSTALSCGVAGPAAWPSDRPDHVGLALGGRAQHHQVPRVQSLRGELAGGCGDLQLGRPVEQQSLGQHPVLLQLDEELL